MEVDEDGDGGSRSHRESTRAGLLAQISLELHLEYKWAILASNPETLSRIARGKKKKKSEASSHFLLLSEYLFPNSRHLPAVIGTA